MTVRRLFTVVAALFALLFGAACGNRDADALPAETDEPLFVQAIQLKKQERKSEALASFLKVIEKRGERASAESHLEVGVLYLHHTKDPELAIYHFRKYLELQPNSKQSPYVRGMVSAARRELAKGMMLGTTEDQSVRAAMTDEVERLRRENNELRSEIQTLRGVGSRAAQQQPQQSSRMISVSDELRSPLTQTPPAAHVADSGITPAQQRPPLTTNGSRQGSSGGIGLVAAPVVNAPPSNAPNTAANVAVNSRLPTPSSANSANTRPIAGGRTVTVAPKQTLFSIAREHGVKVDDIVAANRGVITNPNNVPVGTVLRIPAPAAKK